MNMTILIAVLVPVMTVTFGIVASLPMHSCDKLKDVNDGADNYNRYLVKVNDTHNYLGAEYIVDLVNQYQTTLDQDASNVHEPLVRSQLKISENVGILHGTLSKQALLLVCLDGRVEFIVPDYSRSAILPKHSSKTKDAKVEEVHNANCSKLLIKRPFSGNNYSIIFKRKASSNTLMHVITKMDLLKINDSSFIFQFYYAIRRRNKIIMIAGMNNKAIEIICKEQKIKLIRPNYDTTVINKRDARNAIATGLDYYPQ